MKIYLVERQDRVGWDEYDSFVVRAENEEDALIQCDYTLCSKENGTTVTEIKAKGEKGRILGSFNAG
jgi:urease accessory protein UreE